MPLGLGVCVYGLAAAMAGRPAARACTTLGRNDSTFVSCDNCRVRKGLLCLGSLPSIPPPPAEPPPPVALGPRRAPSAKRYDDEFVTMLQDRSMRAMRVTRKRPLAGTLGGQIGLYDRGGMSTRHAPVYRWKQVHPFHPFHPRPCTQHTFTRYVS